MNMQDVGALLQELADRGAKVHLDGDTIRVVAADGVIDGDEQRLLVDNVVSLHRYIDRGAELYDSTSDVDQLEMMVQDLILPQVDGLLNERKRGYDPVRRPLNKVRSGVEELALALAYEIDAYKSILANVDQLGSWRSVDWSVSPEHADRPTELVFERAPEIPASR